MRLPFKSVGGGESLLFPLATGSVVVGILLAWMLGPMRIAVALLFGALLVVARKLAVARRLESTARRLALDGFRRHGRFGLSGRTTDGMEVRVWVIESRAAFRHEASRPFRPAGRLRNRPALWVEIDFDEPWVEGSEIIQTTMPSGKDAETHPLFAVSPRLRDLGAGLMAARFACFGRPGLARGKTSVVAVMTFDGRLCARESIEVVSRSVRALLAERSGAARIAWWSKLDEQNAGAALVALSTHHPDSPEARALLVDCVARRGARWVTEACFLRIDSAAGNRLLAADTALESELRLSCWRRSKVLEEPADGSVLLIEDLLEPRSDLRREGAELVCRVLTTGRVAEVYALSVAIRMMRHADVGVKAAGASHCTQLGEAGHRALLLASTEGDFQTAAVARAVLATRGPPDVKGRVSLSNGPGGELSEPDHSTRSE